jgi:hypothetical protein
LFESANLLSADDRQSTAALIDVRKAFVNQRDEQVHENVHAENVPRDEECQSPSIAATVSIIVVIANCTVWWNHRCKICHDLIPAFSRTHLEKHYQCFGDRSEILIVRLAFSESSQPKRLCKCNGINQEEYKPSRQEIGNRGKTSSGCFEKLIQLVIPRDE